MPGWNDNFSNGVDWSDQAFIEQFWKAVNERITATTTPPTAPATYYVPALGADVQYGGATAPTSTTDKFSVAVLQAAIEDLCTKFVRTDVSIQASNISYNNWNWTLTTLRSAVGLNASGFTRKYPKEIDSAAATTYHDGSACANGDKARNRDDSKVYNRVAGAWVVDDNPYGTAPDTATAYGIMQAGDYIGPWLFNEMRDCLNKLIHIKGVGSWLASDGAEYQREGQSGAIAGTWAATKTAGEASWDANAHSNNRYAPNPGDDTVSVLQVYTFAQRSGSFYLGDLFLNTGYQRTGTLPTAFAKSVDFYVRAVKPDGAAGDVFGDNGYPLLDHAWSKWTTNVELATATASQTGYIFDATQRPEWDPANPIDGAASGTELFYGADLNGDYETDSGNVASAAAVGGAYIIRYDVADGFQYVL